MRREPLIVRALPQGEETRGEPWGEETNSESHPSSLILPHTLLESHSQQLFDTRPASHPFPQTLPCPLHLGA